MINSTRLFSASAPLLAIPPLQSPAESSQEDAAGAEQGISSAIRPDTALEEPSPAAAPAVADDSYAQLQQRLLLATLIAAALAVSVTALVFDVHTAASVLAGALSGVLYLRLLARSVARIGPDAKKIGKLQLLVPVVLVLTAARLPQLELLPALLGFLLYKPALILQVALDLRAGRS